MKTRLRVVIVAWGILTVASGVGAKPKAKAAKPAVGVPGNLAPRAKITADSVYSAKYAAKFVADGIVPAQGGRDDIGRVWVVRGDTHRQHAKLTFEWKQPVTVAEVVYYGRTGWDPNENFKDYVVLVDDAPKPIAKGQLKSGHGPQRIPLGAPTRLRKLTLQFTSSYGGPNPGASEVQVFSASPSDKVLGKFMTVPGEVGESAELAEELRAGKLGFDKLLLVHRREINCSHVYTYHSEGYKAGGGLYVLSLKDGKLTKLVDSPNGQILDCELSYDGREVLFSWKQGAREYKQQFNRCLPPDRKPEHQYRIWRINIDGTGLTPLTDTGSNNMNPCWLPDGGIAFLSDRKPAFAYCFVTTSPVLYRMERDGSKQRRLSANYLNDFSPSVLHSGRIVYSRWEYVDRPAIPIQSLWTINPDGTGLSGLFGNRVLDPGTFMQARSIPGSHKLLCTLAAHNGACRGAIAVIDPSHGPNAQEGIQNLTLDVKIGRVDKGNGNSGPRPSGGPYETPFPLDDKHFLVSKRGRLLVRDYEGEQQATVINVRDGIGWYCAQPVRSRPRPPLFESGLPPADKAEPWATVFMQDVYIGLEPHVKRGEIKQIAVVQEIEKSQFAPQASPSKHNIAAFGFQFPLVSCGATYAPKRHWGTVKVEQDGSACFKVPTGKPIYFMALDAEGRAVQRMRSFTHFMPGETQSCVGCHDSRNEVAASRTRAVALERKAHDLTPPEWGATGFSFPHIVQPVLDRNCIGCHNAREAPKGIDLTGDRTDFFNVAYEHLARRGTWGEKDPYVHGLPTAQRKEGRSPYTSWIATINGTEYNILMIKPKEWGSHASKLSEIIRSGHPDKDGKPRFHMPDRERRRIYAWIDLNVPYYHTSNSNYQYHIGCRQMVPKDLNKTLARVAKDRCASCHKGGKIPRQFYLRIEKPQLNSFLLAPLAESAGGTEKCGKAIFASPQDADYQAILKTFQPLHKMLADKPRLDMVDIGTKGLGTKGPREETTATGIDD